MLLKIHKKIPCSKNKCHLLLKKKYTKNLCTLKRQVSLINKMRKKFPTRAGRATLQTKKYEISTPKRKCSSLLPFSFPNLYSHSHTFPNTNTHFPPSQIEHPTTCPEFGFPRDLSSPLDSFSLLPLCQVCEIKLKPFPQIPSQVSVLYASKQALIPHTFKFQPLTLNLLSFLCSLYTITRN
jgi:hypothetical protein